MTKKLLSILLTIVSFINLLVGFEIPANAKNVYESEPNDTVNTANQIEPEDVVFGVTDARYSYDYFSFDAKKEDYYRLYIYDYVSFSASTTLLYIISPSGTSSSLYSFKFDEEKGLHYYDFYTMYNGTYYFKFYNSNNFSYSFLLHKHNVSILSAIEPTCSEFGYTEGKFCSVCNYTIVQPTQILKKSHNVVIDDSVLPTCITNGKTEGRHCSSCGEVLVAQSPIKATGHKQNVGVVTTKATCAKAGVKTYSCTVCQTVIKTETIKATGKHTYDLGKVTKAPTSSVTGVMTYTCKTCGAKKTSIIAKLPKASISKLTAKSKGFTASWKKVSSATGYQIQYSTSSKFSSPTTVTISENSTVSKSVTKLKSKKKYYVRIRTYKTINGKKYYSSWSGSKSVITKK